MVPGFRTCFIPGMFPSMDLKPPGAEAMDIPGFSNHPGPRLPNKTPFLPSRSQQSGLRRRLIQYFFIHIYIHARITVYTDNIWVCLKMGYTPNYSHLVGIMIINHWV